YHLGSLISYLFLGQGATELVITQLDPRHRHENWREGYDQVLPYLLEATARVQEDLRRELPVPIRDDLASAFMQLCHPDIAKRGHPAARARKTPFQVERYVSLFNYLSSKYKIEIKRAANGA